MLYLDDQRNCQIPTGELKMNLLIVVQAIIGFILTGGGTFGLIQYMHGRLGKSILVPFLLLLVTAIGTGLWVFAVFPPTHL